MDFRRTVVTRDKKAVNISAREFKLLRYLIEHSGATISRDELLNEVWGYNSMTTTRTVDVHISSLRQKIEEDPRHPKSIVTIHGYCPNLCCYHQPHSGLLAKTPKTVRG